MMREPRLGEVKVKAQPAAHVEKHSYMRCNMMTTPSTSLQLLRRYRLWTFHVIYVTYPSQPHVVFRPFRGIWPARQHIVREAHIEGIRLFDLPDIFLAELQPQRLNVAFEMVHLPPTTDREHIRRLVHDISQRNARDPCVLPLGDLLQDFVNLFGILCLGHVDIPSPVFPLLLFRLEVSSTQGAPRRQGHSLVHAHRDDLSLKVALGRGPFALVDGELTQTVLAGVSVTFGNDPGRGIGYTKI